MGKRVSVQDAEREQVALAPPPPVRQPGSIASLLQLQRSAGNHAVAQTLARNGPVAPPPGPVVPAPVVDPEEQVYADAVKASDWPKAAASLVKLAKPVAKLSALSVDQLRLLQDAIARAGSALGGTGSVLVMAIALELKYKGVADARLGAGAAYGKLEFKAADPVHGNKTTGKKYEYDMSITFTPDTAVVDAAEIAFIQTVRLVDTASGDNKDPEETNKKRQTATATSVDRLGGKEQGWYGLNDDKTAGGNLTPWRKTDPTKPAKMTDKPSWNKPSTTWQFETLVVCRSGTDAGKVYAVVTWGFTVDADLKLTPLSRTITNKQSAEATSAIGKWNDQAAGPAADRNAPGQKSLPALK